MPVQLVLLQAPPPCPPAELGSHSVTAPSCAAQLPCSGAAQQNKDTCHTTHQRQCQPARRCSSSRRNPFAMAGNSMAAAQTSTHKYASDDGWAITESRARQINHQHRVLENITACHGLHHLELRHAVSQRCIPSETQAAELLHLGRAGSQLPGQPGHLRARLNSRALGRLQLVPSLWPAVVSEL